MIKTVVNWKHYLPSKNLAAWLLPILFMALLTPFTPSLDLTIARYFYVNNHETSHFSEHLIYQFIYTYALIPAQLMFICAGFAYLISFIRAKYRLWRLHALYLILTLAIGSGVIIHLTLKDHWGRPRPKQVIEFGGTQEFRPFYQPNFFNQPEPSKSFPCGHCSMGFYFFSLFFLGSRLKKKWLSRLGIFLAIVLGTALSITRIAQGGHFFSDVLISCLVMWLTALVFDWLVHEELT